MEAEDLDISPQTQGQLRARFLTPSTNPDNIALHIIVDGASSSKRIFFNKHWSVNKCLKVIAEQTKLWIKNPEAYGLCLLSREEDEKWLKKQAKKKLKVGTFRDDTKWLEENHPLEYY